MTLKHIVALAAITFTPSLALAGGTEAFDRGMQPILQDYLKIQGALAGDKTTGVSKAADAIAKAAKKLDASTVTGEHAEHYKALPATLAKTAQKLAAQKGIDKARDAFRALSKPMAMWGTMSKPKGVVVAFCSMAKGSWLQDKGEMRNPYYGKSMLTCGEVVGGDGAAAKSDEMGHGDMKSMKHGDMKSMKHGEHAGH